MGKKNGGGGKKRWWQCVKCASAFSKRSRARGHACAAAPGAAASSAPYSQFAAKLVADVHKLKAEMEQAPSAPDGQFWAKQVADFQKLKAEMEQAPAPAPGAPDSRGLASEILAALQLRAETEQAPAPTPDEEWKARGGKLMRLMGWTEGSGLGRHELGVATVPAAAASAAQTLWGTGLGLAAQQQQQQQQQTPRACHCASCAFVTQMPRKDCRNGQACQLPACHFAHASPAGGSRKEGAKPAFMLQACPRRIGCATHGCELAHPSPARQCLFARSRLQHIAVPPSPAAVWCGSAGGLGGAGAGEGSGGGGGEEWSGDGDGEWDEESSGDFSGSDDEGMCGFSGRDCSELLCQGLKPWDHDAAAVLAALDDY